MNHISIDIETFSNQPNPALATIGACDTLEREFYVVVHDETGHFSPSTIRWHACQEAPKAAIGADEDVIPLPEALAAFGKWLSSGKSRDDGEAALWTHATFDIPILANAYHRIGKKAPWHYRNCKDLRTLYMLAGGRPSDEQVKMCLGDQAEGMRSHHGLDDAKWQLTEVMMCLELLRKKGLEV